MSRRLVVALGLALSSSVSFHAAFGGDPPMTPPAGGGMSIEARALQVGDIIVSTTKSTLSGLIRAGTSGDVSHAILVVDTAAEVAIVEAISDGVRRVAIDTALADASLAVAFRHSAATAPQNRRAADFALAAATRHAKYDRWGLVSELRCILGDKRSCPAPLGDRPSFYCSSLVVEAFNDAGVTLLEGGSWSPTEVASLRFTERLRYVGHLRTP